MTDRASPSGRNHALWTGPLVALFGVLSYYTVFRRWPALSDLPWVNLLILALGVGLSLVGLRRSWGRGIWRPAAGLVGLALSGYLASYLAWYCFVRSYELPTSPNALAIGAPLPTTVLDDQDGQPYELDALTDGRLLVVFYRGFW